MHINLVSCFAKRNRTAWRSSSSRTISLIAKIYNFVFGASARLPCELFATRCLVYFICCFTAWQSSSEFVNLWRRNYFGRFSLLAAAAFIYGNFDKSIAGEHTHILLYVIRLCRMTMYEKFVALLHQTFTRWRNFKLSHNVRPEKS